MEKDTLIVIFSVLLGYLIGYTTKTRNTECDNIYGNKHIENTSSLSVDTFYYFIGNDTIEMYNIDFIQNEL